MNDKDTKEEFKHEQEARNQVKIAITPQHVIRESEQLVQVGDLLHILVDARGTLLALEIRRLRLVHFVRRPTLGQIKSEICDTLSL